MRLGEPELPGDPASAPGAGEPGGAAPRERTGPSYVSNYHLVPWLVGLLLGAVLYWGLGWPRVFCVTFGLIAALIGGQIEALRQGRVTVRIEGQLSDAIDLMVAALQAGGGTLSAMENALHESQLPLRPQLEDLLGRIRYGDDPQQVLRALEQRVPLEVFRLFVSTLSVHWETGGSLGPTLATVGKVVRDRIEVNRRIRALTTQGRASVIAVLGLTYFLALIMWRNDPHRMHDFLATNMGQMLAAGAMLFQAVGVVWSAILSKLRY